MSFVITHPIWGVFLGDFLGMAFWSRLSPPPEVDAAPCFPSLEEAQNYVATWQLPLAHRLSLQARPVTPDRREGDISYASMAALHPAGIEPWLVEGTPCVGPMH